MQNGRYIFNHLQDIFDQLVKIRKTVFSEHLPK